MTSDGRPYGPIRYQQIVEERYQISKYTHTSYKDLDDITPLERRYLLELIKTDLEREKEIRDRLKHK